MDQNILQNLGNYTSVLWQIKNVQTTSSLRRTCRLCV